MAATGGRPPVDYSKPRRYCDVVMKGGITSGVVYPRAVCELAEEYRFKCVGGTSAGAIAAAATAAAEYGRFEGGGFERLEQLPAELGNDGRLQSLFRPQRQTRRLFRVLIGALNHGIPGVIWAALVGNFFVALLGAALGAALLLFSILHWTSEGFDALAALGCVAGAGAALLGAAAAVSFRLAHILFRDVPENGFGICSGSGEGKGRKQPLTPWLTGLLDDCAGLDPCAGPLTFGHLWAGPGKDPAHPPGEGEDRFVELEMMTTNLVQRVGRRIPWTERGWYFDPDEFRKLFPERVVKWMEEHPQPLVEPGETRKPEKIRESELHRAMMRPRLPLPAPKDLPVVVATRMSLSFPVLLSAVPLWAFDFERKATNDRGEAWTRWIEGKPDHWKVPDRPPAEWGCKGLPKPLEPEVCWFSDGGISSNFPIQFFDSLVPGRPTFGINLRPFPLEHKPDKKNQANNVAMVRDNLEGFKPWWYRLPTRKPHAWVRDSRLPSFLIAAVRTMQNRMDETQIRAPGYRDRIAHVELTDKEGGMNLTMPHERIINLSERGHEAAVRLRDAYTAPYDSGEIITWDNHRWIRLRSALAALEQMHVEFAEGFRGDPYAEKGRSYEELLTRADGVEPKSYRWKLPNEKPRAEHEVEEILKLGTGPDAKALEGNVPKPRAEGRIVPKR